MPRTKPQAEALTKMGLVPNLFLLLEVGGCVATNERTRERARRAETRREAKGREEMGLVPNLCLLLELEVGGRKGAPLWWVG